MIPALKLDYLMFSVQMKCHKIFCIFLPLNIFTLPKYSWNTTRIVNKKLYLLKKRKKKWLDMFQTNYMSTYCNWELTIIPVYREVPVFWNLGIWNCHAIGMWWWVQYNISGFFLCLITGYFIISYYVSSYIYVILFKKNNANRKN